MYNAVFEEEGVWQPKEIIDLGDGRKIGITSDDGYYVILKPGNNGSWKPTNWIPARAAKRLGELASVQIAIGAHLAESARDEDRYLPKMASQTGTFSVL